MSENADKLAAGQKYQKNFRKYRRGCQDCPQKDRYGRLGKIIAAKPYPELRRPWLGLGSHEPISG
jgi:hypothetical protein